MSDFILEYDVLEAIAKNSKCLGRRAEDYGDSLQSKIISGIDNVTGAPSGYLINARDMVKDKINILKHKSDAFYSFAEQVSNLLVIAEQTDQEVADAIAAQREYFLDYHETLRIEDWKAKLLDLLVDVKNSIPLLNLLADIFKGLEAIFESLGDTVKHWYECGGGKYIINIVWSIGEVALAIAGLVAAVAALAVPGAAFFAVCGMIGASIALVNSVTNVCTSFRAANAGTDGNPAWAVIYGKQDKLSDVLRQRNFGNGALNSLSNLGAGALDLTETFCDIVGIAEIAGIAKLFKGNAFKKLKNGTLNYSDLKNSAKNGIVDLKNNIKNGYGDLKNGSKSVEIVTEGSGNAVKGKGAFNGEVANGEGFGKLANKEITVTQKGLDKVKNHISNNGFDAPENSAMINRIETALKNGEKITGADASYYMHELKESTLMSKGLSYEEAHVAALETYQVSPFSVYHPEVIQQDPSAWGKPWFNFWGIKK